MQDSIVGTEIDGFHIQEILGSGGMGIVYQAQDVTLSREVALKCINRSLGNDESFLRRFRSEARALAQIDSPYIVQVYTLSRMEIGLVIVMEFVKGGNLKHAIGEEGIAWERALPLVQQMLTALEHAHSSGIIHRDIKPHNILLADVATKHGNRVKMTDFGLAKINTTGERSRTVTEGVYGSLNYMSPEQVEGLGEVDHRSDIYSLGMTVYEMIAGRLPFEDGGTTYRIMRKIVEEELPPLSHFTEGIPDALEDIVMRTLKKDPADRYQSASEMRAEIDELANRYSGKVDGVAAPSGSGKSELLPHEDTLVETRAAASFGSSAPPSAPPMEDEAVFERGKRTIGVVFVLLIGLLSGGGYVAYENGFFSTLLPGAPLQVSAAEDRSVQEASSSRELPVEIESLVDLEEASVLRRAIDEKVQKGTLIKGTGPKDFFISPKNCYIFVVADTSSRIEAILDTGSVRVDLKSRRPLTNWSEKYADHSQIWIALTK